MRESSLLATHSGRNNCTVNLFCRLCGCLQECPISASDIFDIDASLHCSVVGIRDICVIVTNKGGGHTVHGRNYKEYQINDFSGWLRNNVEKCSHWNRIERCSSSSDGCRKLNQRYLSAQDFFNHQLSPLEIIWGLLLLFHLLRVFFQIVAFTSEMGNCLLDNSYVVKPLFSQMTCTGSFLGGRPMSFV
ncbi:hypothetical protein SUGI_1138390 [Cryptomeria japonica]|nr:hypothetical protein SUGI_1138390 [Cryptomeria japonica]